MWIIALLLDKVEFFGKVARYAAFEQTVVEFFKSHNDHLISESILSCATIGFKKTTRQSNAGKSIDKRFMSVYTVYAVYEQ